MQLFWNQKRVFKKILTSKKKCFGFGITRVNDLKIFNNPFPTWKTGLDMSEKKLVGGLTTLVFNSKVWWHWPSVPPLRRAFGRTRNAGESHRRCGHTVERRCGRTVEHGPGENSQLFRRGFDVSSTPSNGVSGLFMLFFLPWRCSKILGTGQLARFDRVHCDEDWWGVSSMIKPWNWMS